MSKKTTKARVESLPTTVYIGPSLPGLTQYTVFRHGMRPAHVRNMIEENDAIAQLIVPVTELQYAREQINTPGHILNYYAKQLLKG